MGGGVIVHSDGFVPRKIPPSDSPGHHLDARRARGEAGDWWGECETGQAERRLFGLLVKEPEASGATMRSKVQRALRQIRHQFFQCLPTGDARAPGLGREEHVPELLDLVQAMNHPQHADPQR